MGRIARRSSRRGARNADQRQSDRRHGPRPRPDRRHTQPRRLREGRRPPPRPVCSLIPAPPRQDPHQRFAPPARLDKKRSAGLRVAVGCEYMLERQENGWWLVRFPKIPEALTEGETRDEAHANAMDCLITVLEGYMKAGRPIPRPSAPSPGRDRAALLSLVAAKLAVYETMRNRGWS